MPDPVRDLVIAATARQDTLETRSDAHEARIRALEIELAVARGAATGLQRVAPWIGIIVSIIAIAKAFMPG